MGCEGSTCLILTFADVITVLPKRYAEIPRYALRRYLAHSVAHGWTLAAAFSLGPQLCFS